MTDDVDYSHLSLRELQDMAKQIDKALASNDKRRRSEALAAAETAARQAGYNLVELVTKRRSPGADLMQASTPAKRRPHPTAGTKLPPKYRDPNDAANTWSGRGARPRWFRAAIEAGTPVEAMAVPTP